MGARGDQYSSQSRAFKRRGTTVRECASRGTCGSLYRADCATCGPSTLHARGACVVCGAERGAKAPKVGGRRRKPVDVQSAADARRELAAIPMRRSSRGAGIARA